VESVIEWLAKHRMAASNELKEPPAGMTHVKRALVIANKMDSEETQQRLESLFSHCAGRFPVLTVFCRRGDGLEQLRETVYKALDIIRVYTKPRRQGRSYRAVRGQVGQHRGGCGGDGAQGLRPQPEICPGLGLRQVRWAEGQKGLHLQDGDIVELHI